MKEKLAIFFGTGLGAGLIPIAPGTWGTVSSLPAILFANYILGVNGVIVFILISILGNYWCYPTCETKYGVDPGSFVLDEWVGMGITIIPVILFQFDLFVGFGIGFALFRFFDISKILGINELQNLPEAHGVLMDDVLAGLYSALCLSFLIFAF